MSVLAEKRKKAGELATEIKKQGTAYNERKKAAEKDPAIALWPDETRTAWEKVNSEYDTLRNEIKSIEDDESINSRITEVNDWEGRSTHHGRQKPGLDDINPASGQAYGEDFEDLDEARSFAQRQADGRQFMRAFIVAHINPGLLDSRMRDACQRLHADPRDSVVRAKLLPTEDYKRFQRAARVYNHAILEEKLGEQQRSMSKGGAGTGAELVPITFINTIEMAMLATSPFFAFVDTIRTETGEQMKWPVGDDTANEGQQIGEGADINALAQPDAALEQLTLGAYDFTSGFIKVSLQLTRDSLPNVDLLVAEMLGQRLARIKLKRATLGNGTTQPGGIVVQAAAGVTSAVAAAISADDTINLQHSVDPHYRANGMYMAHDAVIKSIRLLKDTTGRFLWASGLKDGIPDTLNGQGIIYNQYMQNVIATTNITMLYGDYGYYKAREVGNVLVQKLTERFAETLHTGFLGYQGFDGRLQRWTNNAPCPVKKLTQA